jgi:nucleotide-binding universal stress UspA family protein
VIHFKQKFGFLNIGKYKVLPQSYFCMSNLCVIALAEARVAICSTDNQEVLMSFNRILVSMDRDPQQPEILKQAIDLAQEQSANLFLMYSLTVPVAQANTPPIGMAAAGVTAHPGIGMSGNPAAARNLAEGSTEMDQELEQSREWLQRCAQQAIDRGVIAEYECRVGEPGVQTCELADSWNADLVIVGRRGREGLSEALLGSVSNYVVHNAPCSVLVVQDQTQDNPEQNSSQA